MTIGFLRLKLAFLFALAFAPMSPRSLTAQSLEAAAFMEGCWVEDRGGVRSEEIWMAPAGGIMLGMARVIRTGRPASWESTLIHIVDGTLTFSASPSGQAPADFAQATAAKPTLRFENRTHDFPQAIEYRPEGPDAMHARVFGAYQDAEPAFVVALERTSCPGAGN